MKLTDEITNIRGIGPKMASLFGKLQIDTMKDLLFYIPNNYEKMEKACSINSLDEDSNMVTLHVKISSKIVNKKVRNLNITSFCATDETGNIDITFFNMPYLLTYFRVGQSYYFRGKPQFKNNKFFLEQPQILTSKDYFEILGTLISHYSLTKGLTNKMIQKTIKQSLDTIEINDYMPSFILEKYHLLSLKDSLHDIHIPTQEEQIIAARKRLVFDEFFFFFYFIRKMKALSNTLTNEAVMKPLPEIDLFIKQLPFELTSGQKSVWDDIKINLGSKNVMNRLVQGDVGSGKTMIALLAIFMTCGNGYQAALMAPTEVLAKQHFETFKEMIATYHLPIEPVLLVGSLTQKEKKIAYEQIQTQQVNLVIGTHAVIQEKVIYKKLALVITDEQHRFGVKQREQLAQKGLSPHVLVMSATPIPRTLAIICYGDLLVSQMKELPAKRLPIKNCVVDTSYQKAAYKLIMSEVSAGRQAYIICPMVEESETMDLENVVDYEAKLRSILPTEINTSYLHGKMPADLKNEIMQKFHQNEIHVLVSTTVIEVGINVPNATIMMVENAERFGLAQLHQLRGRVGRGEHQSYCIFVNHSKSKLSKERLEILNTSNDGFFIAEEDLRLRGPGDIFGIIQSGAYPFKIGDIYTDQKILQQATQAVDCLLKEDEILERKECVLLKEAIDTFLWKPVNMQSL